MPGNQAKCLLPAQVVESVVKMQTNQQQKDISEIIKKA